MFNPKGSILVPLEGLDISGFCVYFLKSVAVTLLN